VLQRRVDVLGVLKREGQKDDRGDKVKDNREGTGPPCQKGGCDIQSGEKHADDPDENGKAFGHDE
jgi:hypothetical protein